MQSIQLFSEKYGLLGCSELERYLTIHLTFLLWIFSVRLYRNISKTKMLQDAKDAQETVNLAIRIGQSREDLPNHIYL